MATRTPQRRRRRTNSAVADLVSYLLSALLLVAGLGATGVGIYAWTSPRPAEVVVKAAVPLAVGASPLFDRGTTLFGPAKDVGARPTPKSLDCSLIRDKVAHPLTTAADPDVIGTRVVKEISLFPLVEVGPTEPGDRLYCKGRALASGQIWLLPTQAGPSSVPLSVVIGGLGLLGLAALVNPAVRGMRYRY